MSRSMRCFRLCAFAVAWLLLMPAAAAGEATPPVPALPDEPAPYELGDAILPADREAVLALFATLPGELDGAAARPLEDAPDRVIAAWGEIDPGLGSPPLRLIAMSLAGSDFFPPGFTAGDYIALGCDSGGSEVIGCGQDGQLAWLQVQTTVGIAGEKPGTPDVVVPLHTLTWGTVDGRWLYSAAATTPEGVAAIVTAFLDVATMPAATPAR